MNRYKIEKDRVYKGRFNILDTQGKKSNDEGEFIEFETVCACYDEKKADLILEALITKFEFDNGYYD